MGGERFDTPQPEAYLFGENADLNFLGSRPTPVSTNFVHSQNLLKHTNKGVVEIYRMAQLTWNFQYPGNGITLLDKGHETSQAGRPILFI